MHQKTAWDEFGEVIAKANVLEELIQLKLENPGITRENALKWALEMVELYSRNYDSIRQSTTSNPRQSKCSN